MQITEVRVKLMEHSDDRLQAFCSITFNDSFVVRDLKIIEGANGVFVAMPSRKLTGHCNKCGSKNHLRANYCNQCGGRLKHDARESEGRTKLYADIAHPINSECREMIQDFVIKEFDAEMARASQPGYISRYDDDYDDVNVDDLIGETGDKPEKEGEAAKGSPDAEQSSEQPPHSGPPKPHTPPQTPDASKTEARKRGERPSQKKTDSGFGSGVFGDD